MAISLVIILGAIFPYYLAFCVNLGSGRFTVVIIVLIASRIFLLMLKSEHISLVKAGNY